MNQSNTIQKIMVPLLVAVLALGAGYYAGQDIGRQKQEQMLKEVFSSGIFANGVNLFGEITAISPDKGSVSVEVNSIMSINLPKEYQNKTVLITGDTKIVLRENKTPEVLSEEMQNYQDAVKKAKGGIVAATPPSPYFERALTVDELKVGDSIHFSSKSETGTSANVLDNRFTAIEVFVTRQ